MLASEENSRINEPALSQPLCTALQVALVDFLAECNVRPSVVVGHSSGEIAVSLRFRRKTDQTLIHEGGVRERFNYM